MKKSAPAKKFPSSPHQFRPGKPRYKAGGRDGSPGTRGKSSAGSASLKPARDSGPEVKKDRHWQGQKQPVPGKSENTGTPAKRAPLTGNNGEMPLNKFIAQCGICSRRMAADLVKAGKVAINGTVIIQPATRVTGRETISLEGKRITPQKELIYILLNKPRGFLTTVKDPRERKTVMELVREATADRIFPVGRLDRNTSGLLLLTNDGELAQKLAHPSHNIKKVYHALLDKPLHQDDYRRIMTGVELEDGMASVDNMEYVDGENGNGVGLEIHSGKNRIVRRIFEHLGYRIESLDRVMYAGLTKKNIPRGKWRLLSEKEVILLRHFK